MPDLLAEGFLLISYAFGRGPTLDGETFRVGIDWLKANAKPAIPPLCKHRVLCIVERLFDDASLPQEAVPREVLSLVIQIQPIALEHTGTWQKLSELLVHLLRGNPPSFQWLVKALAEPSDIFVEAVQNEGRLGELFSEMHGLDLSDFASELTFSSRRAERRIGLKFFDALHLTKFAAERLSAASDVDLQRVLCESITMPFYGEEIARLLLALLSRAEIAGADVRQRIATEILTQAKSLPTACGKTFKAAGTDSALLRDAVTMGEKWFERWSAGFSSAVNAFGVPGLSAAQQTDAEVGQ